MVQKLPCYDGALVLRRQLAVHARLLLGHPAPLSGAGLRRRPGALLRPAARRHGLPRVPGADRRVHGGRVLADPGRRLHPAPEQIYWMVNAGMLMICAVVDRRLRDPHPPAPPLGRPPGRPRARLRADRHHQLGPARRRPHGRRDAHVVAGPAGRLRCPARAWPRPRSSIRSCCSARCWCCAGAPDAGGTSGRPLAGAVGAWLVGEPAGDAARPRGLGEVLHASARSGGVDFGSIWLIIQQRWDAQISPDDANTYAHGADGPGLRRASPRSPSPRRAGPASRSSPSWSSPPSSSPTRSTRRSTSCG